MNNHFCHGSFLLDTHCKRPDISTCLGSVTITFFSLLAHKPNFSLTYFLFDESHGCHSGSESLFAHCLPGVSRHCLCAQAILQGSMIHTNRIILILSGILTSLLPVESAQTFLRAWGRRQSRRFRSMRKILISGNQSTCKLMS